MGSSNNLRDRNTLTYYTTERHSIEGEVGVFRLKGEALFVFKKENTSQQFSSIAKVITSARCKYLCPCLGTLIDQQTCMDCSCQKQTKLSTYWTYQNYTLLQQIQHNQTQAKFPQQQSLWNLLTSMSEASLILIKHRLFIDFTLDNIHISPLKCNQLYWGNAQIGNGHRLYYKMMMGDKMEDQKQEGIMSPEELKGLRKGKLMARLDLEKCVMFSLGLATILYANNITDYHLIYDQKNNEIRYPTIATLLQQSRKRYSDKLTIILHKMLQSLPFDRPSFEQLYQQTQTTTQMTTSRTSSRVKQYLPEQTCHTSKFSIIHRN